MHEVGRCWSFAQLTAIYIGTRARTTDIIVSLFLSPQPVAHAGTAGGAFTAAFRLRPQYCIRVACSAKSSEEIRRRHLVLLPTKGCSSESSFYFQNTHEIGPAAELPCKSAQPPKPVLNNGGQCSAAWPRNVLQPSVYCCGRCIPYVTKTIISVSLSGPPSVSTSPCYPLREGDNFRGHRLRNGGPDGLVSLLAASSRVRISAKVFFLLAFVSGSQKR